MKMLVTRLIQEGDASLFMVGIKSHGANLSRISFMLEIKNIFLETNPSINKCQFTSKLGTNHNITPQMVDIVDMLDMVTVTYLFHQSHKKGKTK